MAEKENQVLRFYEHTDYLSNKPTWNKINILVNAVETELVNPQYLWEHPFEQASRQATETDKKIALEDRSLRQTRTQYVNFMKMARNRLVSLLMKGGLNTSEVIDLFAPNMTDVDGQGHSLEQFLRLITDHVVEYGVSYVLTNTRAAQEVTSLKQQQEQNIRPFLIRIHPLDFKDWQNGESGEYEFYRHEYLVTEPRADLSTCPVLAKYNEVTKLIKLTSADNKTSISVVTEIYYSINKSGDIINYHPSSEQKDKVHYNWVLKETIPMTDLKSLPLSTNRIQESWLSDGAPIALKIYNKQSEKDNILYNNGYDKTFVFGDLESAVDEQGNEISEQNKTKKISHNSLCVLPADSKVQKLEPTNLDTFTKAIEEDLMNFFQVVFNQLRVLPSDSRQAESAENIEEQKEALLTRISEKRKELENLFNSIVEDWAYFKNKEAKPNEAQKISFKQPLTLGDVEDLALFIRSIENRVKRYPAWDKAIDKLLFEGMDAIPNRKEVLDEIENTDLNAVHEQEMENAIAGVRAAFAPKGINPKTNQKPPEKSPQVVKKRPST